MGAIEYQQLSTLQLRQTLQDEGNKLRSSDSAFIARKLCEEMKTTGGQSNDIVIDSIRNPAEIMFLRSFFQNFYLLALDASSDVRWLRKQTDYGERNIDQFREDDMRDKGDYEPNYGQQTELCVYLADVVIDNETQIGYRQDWDLFFYNIMDYIKLMRTPLYRNPTYKELHMHIAYALSLKSSCSKRQVGAIIVSVGSLQPTTPLKLQDEIESYVLATGYNDVPIGEKVCSELGGISNPKFCSRDNYEERALRAMKYCPECGTELNLPTGKLVAFRCPKCNARLPRDFMAGKLLDLCRSVHAEEAAILQASKLGSSSLRGTVLYTTTFPCLLCCKSIINAGVSKIIYREPYPMNDSIEMLRNCGVELEKYEGVNAWAFDRMFKAPTF
ncbi:hypothetical protein ES705_37151 [subsurface metagenome]